MNRHYDDFKESIRRCVNSRILITVLSTNRGQGCLWEWFFYWCLYSVPFFDMTQVKRKKTVYRFFNYNLRRTGGKEDVLQGKTEKKGNN